MNILDHFYPTLKKVTQNQSTLNSSLHNSRRSEQDDDFIHANKKQIQTEDGWTKARLRPVVSLWLQSEVKNLLEGEKPNEDIVSC